MDVYLGIDPGAKGAYCILVPGPELELHYMDGKASSKEVFEWLDWHKKAYTIKRTMVEDVHSLGGMSAKSNFSFGGNVKIPHILCELLDIPVELVQPKEWQKAVGVTAKKDAIKENVAELCRKTYPICESKKLLEGKRGGLLDGRSDATMIAHYGFLTHTEQE